MNPLPLRRFACWVVLAVSFAAAAQADPLDDLIALQERMHEAERQGQLREAEKLCREMVRISERAFANDANKRAIALGQLGIILTDLGKYAEAEAVKRQVLELYRQAHGDSSREVGMATCNLAIIAYQQGLFDRAAGLFEQALEIHRRLSGPDSDDTATIINNLAGTFETQGRYLDAETLHRQNLRRLERIHGPNSLEVARCLHNLANSLQGRPAEALQLREQALKIRQQHLGQDHPDVAMTLSALGNNYRQLGRLDEAKKCVLQVLESYQRSVGSDHALTGNTYVALGELAEEAKEFDEAQVHLTRGLDIKRRALGPDHPEVAYCLCRLGYFEMKRERWDEALTFAEQALELSDRIRDSLTQRADNYFLRAYVRWQKGDRDLAIADQLRGLELGEQQRAQFGGAEHDRAKASEGIAEGYQELVAWQRELGNMTGAFMAAERGRARGLVEQMGLARVDHLAGVEPNLAKQLRAREDDAQRRVASLSQQLRTLATEASLNEAQRAALAEDLDRQLATAQADLVNAGNEIRAASPTYRQALGQRVTPLSVLQIQTRLVVGRSLALEYVIGKEAGFVFVIPPQGQSARLEPLEVTADQAKTLDVEPGPLTEPRLRAALVTEAKTGVLDLLRGNAPLEKLSPKLAALWEVLLPQDVRTLLTSGDVEQLIVLPDGPLALLPFETLAVDASGESPKYLLDEGPPIVYGPSANVLLDLKERPPRLASNVEPVLTVGGVLYGPSLKGAPAATEVVLSTASRASQIRGPLKPLPFSETESLWIEELFTQDGGRVGQLLGGQATERNVRQALPGREILHFACHGLADDEHGNLFGALALASAAGSSQTQTAAADDDGFLTLAEIYGLNLTGCELAILSACDTNAGPQQRGEGVWALSRGFVVAGCRRVVASNWLVDDRAAATLVSYYCGGLAKNPAADRDYASSLHAAKRYVRQQPQWQSPYYWAPLVLLGPG